MLYLNQSERNKLNKEILLILKETNTIDELWEAYNAYSLFKPDDLFLYYNKKDKKILFTSLQKTDNLLYISKVSFSIKNKEELILFIEDGIKYIFELLILTDKKQISQYDKDKLIKYGVLLKDEL